MVEIKLFEEMTKEEIFAEYLKMREKLDQLAKKDEELKQKFIDLQANYKDLQEQYTILNEKYMKHIAAKYQSQKNTIVIDMPTLFDDVEDEALKVAEEECEYTEVESYKKRKRKPKEQHISYDNLERKVETLPIPEGEDICPNCGSKMTIKKYEEKEELVIIPEQVYVRVTRIPVLECVNCQSVNEEGKSTYVKVSHPSFLFDRSKCSPELLAYIMDMKYSVGLPLYALEKHFQKHGVVIPRQNMCNWILSSGKYLEPIYNIMKEDLLKYPVIHADETFTQCLNEEGKPATSTSYMFVYRSPKWTDSIVLYDYEDSRKGDNPKEFLDGYSGYLTTDAYAGYNKVKGITRTMCNVHALRKFKEAYKLLPKGTGRKTSEETIAIAKYQKIFEMNTEAENRAAQKYKDFDKRIEYITKIRQKEIKPKFEEFLSWLETLNTGRHSMNEAIRYVLNNRKELTEFLNDGRIDISNNITEQSIRPFVTIRNRCKFYVSTTGADVSAKIYSLVITCEQNGINPYMYFMYLFQTMPNLDLNNKEQLRKLLPYSKQLPDYTKILSKQEIKQILSEHLEEEK